MASPKPTNGVQQLDYLVENASAIYNELKVLEQSIYDLETRYLESTTAQGNIFRGWEAYLDNKPVSSSAASSSASGWKKVKVTEHDRHFSKSSVTSPLHCNNAFNAKLGHPPAKLVVTASSHRKKSHKRSHKKQRVH